MRYNGTSSKKIVNFAIAVISVLACAFVSK